MESERTLNEPTTAGINRRQLLERAGTAATALAAGSLSAKVAQAAEPPAPVSFKATSVNPVAQVTGFTIPLDPPRVVETFTIKGQASPLGEVSFAEHHVVRLDEKGVPRSLTDGIGVFTAANGDAIFTNHHSLLRVTAPGLLAEGAFTIIGGKGSYCGAVGSGQVTVVVDTTKGEVTFNWDGMIQMPLK